jgi:hypothetical protein
MSNTGANIFAREYKHLHRSTIGARISANVDTFAMRVCDGMEIPNWRNLATSRACEGCKPIGEKNSSCDDGFQAFEHGVEQTVSEGVVGQVGDL